MNNNVKYVEQNLDNTQAKIAAKNVLMKDADGNFYLGSDFYSRAINPTSSAKPSHCVFGTNFRDNKFGGTVDHNTFGNNVHNNDFGSSFSANTLGNNIANNTFLSPARHNTFGSNLHRNSFEIGFDSCQVGNDVQNNVFRRGLGGYISDSVFGNDIRYCNFYGYIKHSRFDGNMFYVTIQSNATETNPLQNIHVLAGIRGTNEQLLTVNIPDKYLNSSRELIITTKVTNGGASTPDDIVMYYADEVATQNQLSEGLATIQSLTNTDIDNAIN